MLYLKLEEIRMVSREASWSPRLSLGRQKLGVVVLFQSASLSFADAESVFWHCSENWAWNSCGQLQRDWWINWNAMLIICNWWWLLPVPTHSTFISHVDFHNSSQLASPLPLLSSFSPFSTGRPEWSLRNQLDPIPQSLSPSVSVTIRIKSKLWGVWPLWSEPC